MPSIIPKNGKKYEKRLGKPMGEGNELWTFTVEELKQNPPCKVRFVRTKYTNWKEAQDIVSEILAKENDLSHTAEGLADNITVKPVGEDEYDLAIIEVKSSRDGLCRFGGTQMDLLNVTKNRKVRNVSYEIIVVVEP